MSEDNNRIGCNKVWKTRQIRLPDEVMDELNVEPKELIQFETCEEEETVKMSKLDV